MAPRAAHSHLWVDAAVEQAHRQGPHELIDRVPLPRGHRKRGARAVRDLQLVDGDVWCAHLRDRGDVVPHPVHQDRARALQVTPTAGLPAGPAALADEALALAVVIAGATALSRSCLILGRNQHPACLDQPTVSRGRPPTESRSPWVGRNARAVQEIRTSIPNGSAVRRLRASRAALNALTVCYGHALAVDGTKVNVLAPGLRRTGQDARLCARLRVGCRTHVCDTQIGLI
jgi:NAD(P)-dependent dehydrogenase (short-subunit alcohol dehydrogenase family)